MRTIKTGNDFSQNYTAACEDVRDVVTAFRGVGTKTVAAIYEVAKAIGTNQRRVHRLFFGEGDAKIFDAERQRIRAGVVRTHRDLAAKTPRAGGCE
jgi:hypothetical protein